MCNSVEQYLPHLARDAAEARLRAAWGQAGAERAAVDATLGWAARLWAWVRRAGRGGRDMKRLAVLLLLAACAAPGEAPPSGQGEGTDFAQYDASVAGRRYRIDVVAQSAGTRYIVVTSQGARGIDRSEAPVAYAAVQQIAATACRGGPMAVAGDTARFVDGDRTFDALTQGQPAWMFTGLCGG